MATMNVSLPAPLKSWVEERAQDGSFSNVSDYVRDLIRQDQLKEQAISDVQALIDAGIDSGPPGSFDMKAFVSEKTKGAN